MYTGGGAHLAILQNEAETSSDGLEWAEGVRGISHTVEEEFG